MRVVGAPTFKRSSGFAFRPMGKKTWNGDARNGKRTGHPKSRRLHPRQRRRRSAAPRRRRRCGTLPISLSPNVYEGPRHSPALISNAPLRGTCTGVYPAGASACPRVSRCRLLRSEPLHAVVPRRIRRYPRFVSPRVRRRAISFTIMNCFSLCSLRSRPLSERFPHRPCPRRDPAARHARAHGPFDGSFRDRWDLWYRCHNLLHETQRQSAACDDVGHDCGRPVAVVYRIMTGGE